MKWRVIGLIPAVIHRSICFNFLSSLCSNFDLAIVSLSRAGGNPTVLPIVTTVLGKEGTETLMGIHAERGRSEYFDGVVGCKFGRPEQR